jgi:hypothetical protein
MAGNNGRSLSIAPIKLKQLVRSYLYRKKLAGTLESIQIGFPAAIRESLAGVVFAQGLK